MEPKIICNVCDSYDCKCKERAEQKIKEFEENRKDWVELGQKTLKDVTAPELERYQWLTKKILDTLNDWDNIRGC